MSFLAKFTSSTQEIPNISAEQLQMPKHVAIIMDGNGRWAKKRFLPRFAGHVKGVDAVRNCVEFALNNGIEYLTLFAFSSENWRRPADEVSMLMDLFVKSLQKEVKRLLKNGVRLRIVGDISKFNEKLQALILDAQEQTKINQQLNLTIAANYGGRWDIIQAMNKLFSANQSKNQNQNLQDFNFTESDLEKYLSLSFAPEPDLFIRTGGEQRISNFLLWQLAYSEFYFTDTLWPEFDSKEFELAIASYQQRERRFGRISEQIKK